MSYHCSQALVEEFSARYCLDGGQCAELSTSRFAEKFCFDAKRKGLSPRFPSGTTSEHSMASRGVAKWISSLGDSLASHFPPRGDEREKETSEICGRIRFVSFAKLDPPIASSKMFKDCSPLGLVSVSAASPIQKYRFQIYRKDGRKEISCQKQYVPIVVREWITPQRNLFTTSERYCETWRKAGMMRDGVCYLLRSAELPIGGQDSGLWHSPSAQEPGVKVERLQTKDGKPAQKGERAYDRETGRLTQVGLTQQVKIWPTPRTITGGAESAERKKELGRKNSGGGDLQAAVRDGGTPTRQTWATPNCLDHMKPREGEKLEENLYRGDKANPDRRRRNRSGNLREQVMNNGKPVPKPTPQTYPTPRATEQDLGTMEMRRYSGTSRKAGKPEAQYDAVPHGPLNPDWVEWLMGWPVGWSSLAPLSEEHFEIWYQMQRDETWWGVDPADLEEPTSYPTLHGTSQIDHTGKLGGSGELGMAVRVKEGITDTPERSAQKLGDATVSPSRGPIPRVAVGVKHRVDRLKAIGNGQVPRVVEVAWKLLMGTEGSDDEKDKNDR